MLIFPVVAFSLPVEEVDVREVIELFWEQIGLSVHSVEDSVHRRS